MNKENATVNPVSSIGSELEQISDFFKDILLLDNEIPDVDYGEDIIKLRDDTCRLRSRYAALYGKLLNKSGIKNRFELFTNMGGDEETIVDMIEGNPLTSQEVCDLLNEYDRNIDQLNMELAMAHQRVGRIKKLVYVKYGDEYIGQI
ncbi:hypothetical protein [Methanobrevibacter sp.]|uniref:hypothetical protein n=1 Tax=Methanobrevibacter sp. TaxID=66852 RepID=UPI00386CF2A0